MAQAPELLAENLLETDFLPLLPLRKVRDFSPRLLSLSLSLPSETSALVDYQICLIHRRQ